MEDFSPRQSPRVKDYLLTQTTNASPARLNTHGSTYSGYGSNFPTDHPSYVELKRDYSKALNTIEILRLEKSNLETALKYAKRSRPGDSSAGSYTSAGRRSPDRREYRSDHYAEVERRIYDLKQELEEHKKLLADNYLYTENLKREAHSHHSRLQEIDDLQSRNYLMRDEINMLTRELQTMTNRVADLEEERHQLLEKISADGQQRFPPRGIYKYVDYIYNAIDALPTNHHAYYHFQECFPDNENMEILIEEKDSNTLILQTMKYLTNLLVNLSSNPTTLPSTLPVSSDSKGNSLNLMDKVTPRINGEASPLNQSALNASRSQRINAEQAPTRKGSSNNISRSTKHQQQVEEEEAPVPRSPSRLNLTNMSNHTRKKSLGTGTVKAAHNTQPSFGDGVREIAGTTTPNPNQNQNLSHRSLQKAGTPTNRSNLSMNRTNRPKTNLDVSQRNNSQMGTLNRSGYSSASPKTDRRPSHQRSVLNAQPAAADVSHMSQNRSQNRSRNRIDATPQMLSEQINGVQYERELLERENRLRDLDRELAEKERLLQSRENQNERYPTEAGTAGFGTQASTNEEDKLYAYHSNSRYIDHHKSVASSKPAQTNPKSKSDLNNKSHISNNPSRNQSIRQDTREALDRSNLRDNLNQSHHSAIPNRVIPSITTITDFDGSPKAGNNQTPHSRQDATRKVISPFVFSSDNLDAVNENDRASRSPAVGKCRIQSRPSIPDETTPITANNRVSFQVYSQAGNSPYSRVSGWPQTQDKLDQSTANRSNIRIRDEYHTSHLIDQPAQRPSEYADHQDDDMRRKITFEQQQFDDDEGEEEDIGQNPQQDEEMVSPSHMSLRARNTALRQRGTEYASFRVSFGRTESKDMRNGSPPPDQKGSLFVFDIPKRKRVTHNEQTYDIVKGKTVNYKLKSEGKDYQVNLAKSRTGTRTSTCSDFQSVLSDKPNSPTPSVPIVDGFKEAL